MKKSIKICYGIFLLILATVIVGCGKEKEEPLATPIEKEASKVSVQKIVPMELTDYLTLSGWIEPVEDVLLSTEKGGMVEWVGAEEGDVLKKDQVLARVNVEMLKAYFNQAEAQLELAKANYRRQKVLFDKTLIPPAQMEASEAELKVAEANYSIAKIQFEKGSITSPVDGMLNRLETDEGEVLAPGQVVGRVINIQSVYAMTSLPEKDVTHIKTGETVFVTISAIPEKKFQGKIEFIALAADPLSKAFRTKILIDNQDHYFRPGMIVNITFQKPPKSNAIVIPQTAVLSEKGRSWVFVANDGTALEKEVKTGVMVQNQVEILEGLFPAELVITFGQHGLINGDPVKIVPNPFEEKGEK